jgi:hypothetical protein
MRRSVLSALVALAVLAIVAAGCRASSGSSTSQAPSGSTVLPKVTVAGDSISYGLGASLRTALGSDVDVKVISEGGTGLARPDNFDWPTRLQKLAKEFPPTVLVLSVGSNDAQDLTDSNGKDLVPFASYPPSAAWDAEYTKRLETSFDAFASTGTRVLWVGQVVTADPKVGQMNRHINQLAVAAARSRPFVDVADLAELLGTGETKATRCLNDDGLHLTPACLDEAAATLKTRLPPLAP